METKYVLEKVGGVAAGLTAGFIAYHLGHEALEQITQTLNHFNMFCDAQSSNVLKDGTKIYDLQEILNHTRIAISKKHTLSPYELHLVSQGTNLASVLIGFFGYQAVKPIGREAGNIVGSVIDGAVNAVKSIKDKVKHKR